MFMYDSNFNLKTPLIEEFWRSKNLDQHKFFVSFIGRGFISGANSSMNQLLEKDPTAKKKIRELWNFLLENYEHNELFLDSGFWPNLEKGIFNEIELATNLRKTLEKTDGKINRDYELVQVLPKLSKAAPMETLKIVRLFLLKNLVRGNQGYLAFYLDENWSKTFENLYKSSLTKSDTYALIDDLIREGGRPFWDLKKILKA